MPEIGRIEEVDIRELWPNEAADFTPWLAYQGGLELLGNALGLTFASAKHEVPAGGNRADVVCMEVSNPVGRVTVVIENQLDRLDHGHVGQALTYTNTLEAGICILIATEFTEDHRFFVEAQNSTPGRKVDWYCVRVSSYRVDDSNPVPEFKVVVRPDSQIPSDLRTVPSQVPARPKRHVQSKDGNAVINEFVDRLKFELGQKGYSARWGMHLRGKPRYVRIDIGHSTAQLSVVHEDGKTRVRLHMTGKGHKELYFRLSRYKDSIEEDIGATLQWPTNARRSSVDLGREADLADRSTWNEEIAWCVSKVDLFLDVFNWRLEALKRGESIDPSNKPEAQQAGDALAG